MSKAYSNRALPAGTILREWRLEEVLGVGGFGIVYKGRGIYFDELVAIKEYFPSSISERSEDETVVPIDSDAEEVHALGLKKFVEEAKLLWNLSTPTRHPNIVSVRSLFEIHGTAYMVMDFEDGTSLSRALKQGRKFNEATLRSIIVPIAQGLERAHRVGVLHRDIKPPNILINDDGRAVLIDFGSARFESGEATSTKVTFHTPPYAAIEQYVRTFEQGPWTDIYALGVVLYECITGTKPAEVLERMHGDAGKPLADGKWPGFSRPFLHAVDRAMAIRPDERPQSISAWLEILGSDSLPVIEEDDDDAATRVGTWQTDAPKIVPVAPPAEGFDSDSGELHTGVPETVSKAEFKRHDLDEDDKPVPVDTKPTAKEDKPAAKVDEIVPVTAPAAAAGAAAAEQKSADAAKTPEAKPDEKADAPEGKASDAKNKDAKPADAKGVAAGKTAKPAKPEGDKKKGGSKGLLYAGVAAAGLLGIAVWLFTSGNEATPVPPRDLAPAFVEAASDSTIDAATAAELSEAAQQAGIGEDAIKLLALPEGTSDDGSEATLPLQAIADFANATLKQAEALVRKLGKVEGAPAAAVSDGLSALQSEGDDLQQATTAEAAVAETRSLIEAYSSLRDTVAKVRLTQRRDKADAAKQAAADGAATADLSATGAGTTATSSAQAPAAASAPASSAASSAVTAAHRREFASAVSGARSISRQVIALGDRDKPGSGATEQQKQDYRVRQGAADAARNYEKYLDELENSMRGTSNDAEAVQSIAKANQTRAYLSDLLKRSKLTLR